ncbi:MAG: ABC transporter permease [Proteobacteria bacterium]|nr:ABC transporter permease [Pseudomonadota bacterium]MBU1611408.1 ABC transporter permease [Pseudomonadota bacterium]
MAMLGIFLGALAFTGVQTMGQIMVRKAEMEVEKMGPNLFAIMAGQVRFHRGGGISFRGFSKNMTVGDALAIKAGVPSVLNIAPMAQAAMPIRVKSTTVNGLMTATWPSYQQVRKFYPQEGRFFTLQEQEARQKVVVLGRNIATRLFGTPQGALGELVFIFKAGFRVVGVMEGKGSDLAGVNQDDQVFMPLTTYQRRASNTSYIKGIFIELAEGADMEQVRAASLNVMRKRHALGPGEPDDFSLLEAKETIQLRREALDLMSTLGAIVSTISFAVGGMGILSIMVLLVRTRRKEIGIRRAVGGRRKDIVRQFFLESALMAVVGGGGGVCCCVALLLLFSSFSDYPLILDGAVLVGTLVGSAGLGLAAGAYPAYQASKIEILDVLTG